MPSGKSIVNADAVFDYLAGTLLAQRPRPSGPLGLFDYVIACMHEWQAANPTVHLHKASGYYWAALRDIELDNIDRGLLFMYQAVKEAEASWE